MLAVTNFMMKDKKLKFKNPLKWPFVTIQIPVFNDPVAARCIDRCLNFDYPKDRYEILVADDSTDEKTKKILDRYKGKVKIIRRNNRKGYKSGALNNLLGFTRGEIVVVFDSDFTPGKDFLKRIVKPFSSDEKIAIVQSRMGYINPNVNLVSKFASFLMMVYHNCWMPLNNRIGTVFFCGTGGAIRKNVLIKTGRWNENNLTEDAEISVKILGSGYRAVYLHDLISPGELPFTLSSLLKQQMRWVYGQTRIFIENWKEIWFGKVFNFVQKVVLTFLTIGHVSAPFVLLMAITGQLGWIVGTGPGNFKLTPADIIRFFTILILTSGFLAIGNYAIKQERKKFKMRSFIAGALTIGVILAFTTTIAMSQAILNRKMSWFRTPKWGSISILKFFKHLFSGKVL